jgi:hypothetical protein
MADYGRDTYCTDQIKSGRLVSGNMLLAQALYRRLITPRGTLRGGEAEANYGFDLLGLLGTTATSADIASLPSQIRNELMKDERVDDVEATVVAAESNAVVTYEITITVEPVEGDEFEFVLSVDDVTVSFLGLAA